MVQPIESEKAKERMSEGGKGTQDIAGVGETRTKVAQALGTNRQRIKAAQRQAEQERDKARDEVDKRSIEVEHRLEK